MSAHDDGATLRILVSDKISDEAVGMLRQGAEVDIRTGLSPDELVAAVPAYDGLVVRSATQVTREAIAAGAAGRLRGIARAGVGIDNIDVAAATEHGVLVVNTPGANAQAVAELVVGMMLDLLRHISTGTRSLRDGRWEKSALSGHQLSAETVGIVGYGRVGRSVARLVSAFGAKVLAYDAFAFQPATGSEEQVDLDRLFAESDIITLHTSLNDQSRDLIDRDSIARMKDGVLIINTSRGEVVNEADLLAALESGKVAGVGLDVFQQEPPGASPLIAHPNVVCTPHIGAATAEAQQEVGRIAARSLLAVLTGGLPDTIVNREAIPQR